MGPFNYLNQSEVLFSDETVCLKPGALGGRTFVNNT